MNRTTIHKTVAITVTPFLVAVCSGWQASPLRAQSLRWPPPGLNAVASYSFSWNAPSPEVNADNIVPMFHIRTFSLSSRNINQIRDAMLALPEGRRVVIPRSFIYHADKPGDHRIAMHGHPDDRCFDPATGLATEFHSIWWDKGVLLAQVKFGDLFDRLHEEGVPIDAVILDTEYGLSNWSFNNRYDDPRNNPTLDRHWRAIESDPRFGGNTVGTLIGENARSRLVQLGFDPPDAHLNDTVWQWGKYARCDPQENCAGNYLVWNALALEWIATYRNLGIHAPVASCYPDVIMSDYNFFYWDQDNSFPNHQGHLSMNYGRGAHIGTHQARSFYSRLSGIAKGGERHFQPTPFDGFRYEVNKVRAMYLARPDVPIHAWVSSRGWPGPNLLRNNDLHNELNLHLALTNAELIYWNWRGSTLADDLIHSRELIEIDLMIGYETERRPLTADLSPWEKNFVYSGLGIETPTGLFKVWRFTPRLNDGESIETRILDRGSTRGDQPVVFRLSKQAELVFSNAVIYRPEDPVAPDSGAWVIQAPNSAAPHERRTGDTQGP